MRKILSAIMITALVFSVMTLCAFAAAEATVHVEASKSTVSHNESFTFSVYLSGTYDGYALKFNSSQTSVTVTDVAAESGVYADNLGDAWMLSVIGGLCKQSSEKEKIATVTVTVNEDASYGDVNLEFSNISISNEYGDRAVHAVENVCATIEAPVVTEPDKVVIDSLKILDTGYNELDTIPDTSFTAEVNITNNSSEDAFTVMLCSYDENGVLIDLRYLYTNPYAGQSVSLGASIGNADGKVAKVKAMVFDTLTSFAPLTESVEVSK